MTNAKATSVFWKTVKSYCRACETSPVVSTRLDPTARSNRRTPTIVNFIVDSEAATKAALDGHRGLYAEWQKIVEGIVEGTNTQPSPKIMEQIIKLTAPVYSRRKLANYARI